MNIDYRNKKRILIGIIIVLVLINLTALGTLGYDKYKRNHNKKTESRQENKKIENKGDRIKQFVKKELNLNEKQCSVYFRSMDENFAQSKLMLEKIGKCKKQIIEQTISENPDTVLMNKLCDSLGYFHNRMQRGTNRHFIEMMSQLDSTQKIKLKKILIKMNEGGWNKGENNRQHRNQDWKN